MADLLSRPYTLEVLDALGAGPLTVPALVRLVHAGRRTVRNTLHTLAVEGLVSRHDGGSWDTRPAADACFALTATGHALVDRLWQPDAWVDL
ncbi:GntR family transcriptional regulator [Kutzneria buriramensis]|uniref:Regulatory GntR family protein n=1 Tax=Kutzneria buriramensis TaxID=1045776 RepID=A0A3E0HF01_9PSEU|nr:GntR family transcriptional regulator [Kutzneria buriramensis]REH43851.1 regulatory GntR family protein [Kutzneria buriramensis]